MLTVRRATLADKPAIFNFIRVAYRGREQYKIPARWEWQFENNPYRETHELPFWIALDGGRIVGQTGAQLEPLSTAGRELKVGWSVDTYVLPEYRGRGLGRRLQRANQDAQQVFMSLRMSSANARIKASLGGRPLPPTPVLQLRLAADAADVVRRVRRTSAVLSNLLAAPAVAKFTAGLFTVISTGCWRLRRKTKGRRAAEIEFHEVACFGDDADTVWRSAVGRYPLLVRRDAAYLNWKYGAQPHVNHAKFVIRSDGRPRGVLILRRCAEPEPQVGLIVDLFTSAPDPHLTASAAAFAVDYFLKHGTRVIRAVAGTPAHERTYKSLGFRPLRSLQPVCFPSDVAELATSPGSLYLSYGDHDLEQFPLVK